MPPSGQPSPRPERTVTAALAVDTGKVSAGADLKCHTRQACRVWRRRWRQHWPCSDRARATGDRTKSTFAKRIRAAKPRTKKYDVWDDVISGLGLRVGTSGHRSVFLRRHVRGSFRSATIGKRRHHDLARGAARSPQAPRHLHRIGRQGRTTDPERLATPWTPSPRSSSNATPGTGNRGPWRKAPTWCASISCPPSAI